MVRAFTSSALHLGMLAPPPMLWLSNMPVGSLQQLQLRQHPSKLPFPTGIGGSFNQGLTTNDRLLLKAINSLPPPKVPAVVVAVDDKSSLAEDEESLSDASSYRDSSESVAVRRRAPTSMQHKSISQRACSVVSVKLPLPPGKPLRAKPRLVKANFLKTRARSAKTSVPLKLAVTKASLLKRSSLSQDEKLFVEAAATLVQARQHQA